MICAISFRVTCPELSEAFQKVAFGLGYKWPVDGQKPAYTNKQYLSVNDGKALMHGETPSDAPLVFDLGTEFSAAVAELKKLACRKQWTIAGHHAEVSEGGMLLKVGCQTIHFSTVKEVYDEMVRKQKS